MGYPMNMPNASSLKDRLARTRRRQTNAMEGTLDVAAERREARQVPQPLIVGALAVSGTTLRQDFDALLPVTASFYSYQKEDIEQVLAMVTPSPTRTVVDAEREMRATVRDWMLDVATYDLDSKLPEDLAQRSRQMLSVSAPSPYDQD